MEIPNDLVPEDYTIIIEKIKHLYCGSVSEFPHIKIKSVSFNVTYELMIKNVAIEIQLFSKNLTPLVIPNQVPILFAIVYDALENEIYAFRSIRSIVRETGFSTNSIKKTLEYYDPIFRKTTELTSEKIPLYTLKANKISLREKIKFLNFLITKSI